MTPDDAAAPHSTGDAAPTLPEAYVLACLAHGAWERALDVIAETGALPGYAVPLAAAAERLIAGGEPAAAVRVASRAVELVVVDTGSTDDTVKIARRLGARIAHFTWVDDFAAARNRSLEEATGEW